MRLSINKALIPFLLIGLIVLESAERYLEMSNQHYWLINAGILMALYASLKIRSEIFPTFLFFSLLHVFRPLNEWFVERIGVEFNGTYFLLPILTFLAITLLSKSVSGTLDWWTREKFSRPVLFKMLAVVAIASAVMYLYLINNRDYLDPYLGMLPDGSLGWIILVGLTYALLNSFVEEFIFRGMVWNGLSKIMNRSSILLITQSAIFGLSHFWGLPGGWSGVLQTFILSLFLGYFRLKTGGIVGCILIHFSLNLTQYFMLLSLR